MKTITTTVFFSIFLLAVYGLFIYGDKHPVQVAAITIAIGLANMVKESMK